MLQVENLSKSYSTFQGSLPVLSGVSLELAAGQSLALTGESGSGKSTLLHLIAGLDQADSGRVVLSGQEVTSASDRVRAALRRSNIGLVFQQFNLIPSLDVAANLAFQARIAGRYDAAWQAEIIERLGLEDLLARYPEELSGGQQQRVAIGRAIAGRPELILADEPTGNLDESTGDRVMALLMQMVEASGAALLLVTHEARLAALAERRLVLRQGHVA